MNVHFSPRLLTPAYRKLVQLVDKGLPQKSIAEKMKISLQSLSYRVKRLKLAGILVDGLRSIRKELRLNPELDEGIREKFLSVGAPGGKFIILQCNAHLLSVKYPVITNNGFKFKHLRCRWKGELTEELVQIGADFYNVVLSNKNLFVQFPKSMHIYLEDDFHQADLPRYAEVLIKEIAREVMEKVTCGGLVLGDPVVHASYAFSDKVARDTIKQGIRITILRNGVRSEIDGSKGHFAKLGEVEFTGGPSAAEAARRYILARSGQLDPPEVEMVNE